MIKILFFLFLIPLSARGQLCGTTVPNDITNEFYSGDIRPTSENSPMKNALRKNPYSRRPITEFKVAFWIFNVVNSKINSTDKEEVQRYIAQLNSAFKGAYIQFALNNDKPNISTHRKKTTVTKGLEYSIIQDYYNANMVNVYILPEIFIDGEPVEGFTYIPQFDKHLSEYKKNVVFVTHDGARSTTLIHELGHFFGLLHTHHGAYISDNDIKELADQSNCLRSGDYICDTPADPGLYGYIRTTGGVCEYNYQAHPNNTDTNGVPFSPMVSNYMSYANGKCRNKFTEGQLSRMMAVARLEKLHLKSRLVKQADESVCNYLPTLGAAATAFEYSGPQKAIIFAMNKETYWSNRTAFELCNNPDLGTVRNDYSIVFFHTEGAEAGLLRKDFLNTMIQEKDSPFEKRFVDYFYEELDREILRTPAIFIVQFEKDYGQINIELVGYHYGYLKPRQLLELINKGDHLIASTN